MGAVWVMGHPIALYDVRTNRDGEGKPVIEKKNISGDHHKLQLFVKHFI